MLLRAALLYTMGVICLLLGTFAAWQRVEMNARAENFRTEWQRADKLSKENGALRLKAESAERRAMVAEDSLERREKFDSRQVPAPEQQPESIAALQNEKAAAEVARAKAEDDLKAAEKSRDDAVGEAAALKTELDAVRKRADEALAAADKAKEDMAAAAAKPAAAHAADVQADVTALKSELDAARKRADEALETAAKAREELAAVKAAAASAPAAAAAESPTAAAPAEAKPADPVAGSGNKTESKSEVARGSLAPSAADPDGAPAKELAVVPASPAAKSAGAANAAAAPAKAAKPAANAQRPQKKAARKPAKTSGETVENYLPF